MIEFETKTTASALAEDLSKIVRDLQRTTVQVRGRGPGGGSGVIWAPGLIVTNAHVVRGPTATIQTMDGQTFEATVARWDPQHDLAALTFADRGLPVATAGDSDALRAGELVVAVGNPLGRVGAATLGIVHTAAKGERYVQADIQLLPGNSGGPLADVQGRVVGINAMVAGGLGLAVPSSIVAEFVSNLAPQPVLGIEVFPVTLASQSDRLGLLVTSVNPDGAAQRAGIIQGDIVTSAAGQTFQDAIDLPRALRAAGAGSTVTLEIVRGGQPLTLSVSLAAPQADGSVAA
jgi:serine protease Do